MTWLFFDVDPPRAVMQDDLTKLWPSLIMCIIIYIIRYIVNYIFKERADRITQYKIDTAKPHWLNISNSSPNANNTSNDKPLKGTTINGTTINGTTTTINGTTTTTLTQKQSNKIMSLINTLKEKEANKLFNYASEINLTDVQIRGLKTYFTQIKQADSHKNKFLESTFKLVCMVPISLYGIYVVYFKHDFFINHWKQWINYGDNPQDMEYCKVNHQNEPLTQIYDDWILWYYIVSLGYHLNRAVMQFHNPARKDFVAMFIHHWVTLALMVFSFLGGKTRCGCIILSIHESSDIFLESAKVFSYHSNWFMADVFFIFFFLSWIIMRMIFFCQKLLYSVYICGGETTWLGNAPLIFPQGCIYFLYVLECLHIYWFTYIMKIVINKLSGKRISDTRSGSESEDDSIKKKEE
eukprot:457139_1